MKRTIAIITLIGLPALLIALAGVRLVMYDRSGICSAVSRASPPSCAGQIPVPPRRFRLVLYA